MKSPLNNILINSAMEHNTMKNSIGLPSLRMEKLDVVVGNHIDTPLGVRSSLVGKTCPFLIVELLCDFPIIKTKRAKYGNLLKL